MTARFAAIISIVGGVVASGCAQSNSPDTASGLALVGGTLVDGTGSVPLPDSVVLIQGERIQAVGTRESLEIPDGYEEISTRGMTIVPGLWDLHMHLQYAGHPDIPYWNTTYTPRYADEIMPAAAMQLLNSGVTSARDLGAPPDAIFALKRRILSGELDGPTIFAAGPQLTRQMPDWAVHYRWPIADLGDATVKAQRLLDAGADTLKIVEATALSADEIKAVVAEAHRRGKKVTAHGRTLDEIRRGLEGGVDEFQHIGLGYPEFPQDILDTIAARITAGRPLFWTITVGLPLTSDQLRENPGVLTQDANFAGLPADISADVRTALETFRPQLGPEEAAAIRHKVAQLRQAGVQLLLGTDGGIAGNPVSLAINQEMEAWVNQLGVAPADVLQVATSRAATYMNAGAESGTISANKYADVLVVSGNPLEDISALRNPGIVIKHGKRYK